MGCPLQNPQRPIFHLLSLSTGLIKPNLKVRPSLFPGNVDSGSHIAAKAAKCDNVCLRHSGRYIAENRGDSKGGRADLFCKLVLQTFFPDIITLVQHFVYSISTLCMRCYRFAVTSTVRA